jgi:hypothetical protein
MTCNSLIVSVPGNQAISNYIHMLLIHPKDFQELVGFASDQSIQTTNPDNNLPTDFFKD